MFYEQTQTYRIYTLKFNMERDLSFKSKEKCSYFYVFLEKCRLYSSIFLLILKRRFCGILQFYAITLYFILTFHGDGWSGSLGLWYYFWLQFHGISLLYCFLYFFETSIEPRKFRLSFSFWLLLTLSKLWKKHQTKSKTYSTSTMTFCL